MNNIANRLRQLAATKMQVEKLEKEISILRSRELPKLAAQYGFATIDALIAAVRKAVSLKLKASRKIKPKSKRSASAKARKTASKYVNPNNTKKRNVLKLHMSNQADSSSQNGDFSPGAAPQRKRETVVA